MKIILNENGELFINGVEIKERVFSDELVDYQYRNREDFLDDLLDWIGEAKGSDRTLMKEDLFYLAKQTDEYMLSSILTNEYILISENKERFNEICKEILTVNKNA